MLKKITIFLYILVVIVMATATFVEHANGYRLYGNWWFSLLWGMLTAAAIVYFLKQKVRRLFVVVLHLSFVVILLGALLTHFFSQQGAVHLRIGEQTTQYVSMDGRIHTLPFVLRLDSFAVVYHKGTSAAADYESYLTITDNDRPIQEEKTFQNAMVSMNNICSYQGVRLYQASYDDDGGGSVLSVNSDPWGIPITYTGYALLFIALIWMLIDPKGQYRQVLRSPLLKKGVLTLALLFSFGCSVSANNHSTGPRALPEETAEKFGQLQMLYNDRICPVETYALDFTKKLYGKRHYGDYSALQVLTGFIFYGDEWSEEPIVRIKSGELKETRQLQDYCSVNQFFTPGIGYVLGPYVQEYYRENQHDAFHKQVAKVDDQLMLVMDLREGKPLRLFPYTTSQGETTWYSPVSKIDTLQVPAEHRMFIQQLFTLLYQEVLEGNYAEVNNYLDKLLRYQQKNGGTTIPEERVTKAEHAYNAVPFATILFMVNLTLGFLTLGLFIYLIVRQRPIIEWLGWSCYVLMALSFIILTYCEALRWIISGTIPMSNGYETMLLLAWFIELITLLLYHRFHIMLTFGFLLSGFFLLVSHISQMDPQIGRLMPVLDSPLLTIHVSVIMMSFALLSLTFICGITALVIRLTTHKPRISNLKSTHEDSPIACEDSSNLAALAMLSRVFLYPALTTLGLGIFIGAIWANVSWGNYWSWDPKEVWALITFMVYAVVVHTQSLPIFRRPLAYHIYVTLAFLTILMTYFGVNYILGGLHSYA